MNHYEHEQDNVLTQQIKKNIKLLLNFCLTIQ